jgi:hypothetical protein
VDKPVLDIFNIVLSTACAEVAVLVEEALQVAVDSGGQRVQSDIKFATLVEQRLFAVLLDDVGTLLAVDLVVAHDLSDLR